MESNRLNPHPQNEPILLLNIMTTDKETLVPFSRHLNHNPSVPVFPKKPGHLIGLRFNLAF